MRGYCIINCPPLPHLQTLLFNLMSMYDQLIPFTREAMNELDLLVSDWTDKIDWKEYKNHKIRYLVDTKWSNNVAIRMVVRWTPSDTDLRSKWRWWYSIHDWLIDSESFKYQWFIDKRPRLERRLWIYRYREDTSN